MTKHCKQAYYCQWLHVSHLQSVVSWQSLWYFCHEVEVAGLEHGGPDPGNSAGNSLSQASVETPCLAHESYEALKKHWRFITRKSIINKYEHLIHKCLQFKRNHKLKSFESKFLPVSLSHHDLNQNILIILCNSCFQFHFTRQKIKTKNKYR